MDDPISAHFTEIHSEYTEHNKICNVLQQNQIIGYCSYVDNILTVYNTNATDIDKTLANFNKIPHTLQFTMEKEDNNKINFLYTATQSLHP
jgi:hypothetical protein